MRGLRASAVVRSAMQALGGLLCVSISLAACSHDGEPAELAIWRIVDQGCNTRPQEPPLQPRRDLACDLPQGYAILKDRCGPTHFLLIPTARRTGVESPELQLPAEPNYFELAWEERGRSLSEASAPGEADVGLAINSRYGRSQSQLHIHIDRLRREVRSALQGLQKPLPADTQLALMGHRYRVDHLQTLSVSPFILVAHEWGAQTTEERARLTLAVVSDGDAGFFLLSDRADLGVLDRGHAEELLLAHSCR
ncbi:MAG TPA: CDP-diacylglycerol diphosphatase [Burkholderiaceae bacterium]|nr:CDP-diacylglycerol diphosphatase [Burkholderiaceae bacterium]